MDHQQRCYCLSKVQAALVFIVALLTIGLPNQAFAKKPLPHLNASIKEFTVSGVSSGGYMAVQYQVAHSGSVQGIGVISAGPYECAEGSIMRALKNCMDATDLNPPPTASRTIGRVNQRYRENKIDSPENIRNTKVWLLSSEADRVVSSSVTAALKNYYRASGVLDQAIVTKVLDNAGHAFITNDYDSANPCAVTDKPYINKCGNYDAVGEMLRHLYGGLNDRVANATGELIAFDQSLYTPKKPIDISMSDIGYLYVPEQCYSRSCRVHVVFHGCEQSADQIGDIFTTKTGYNKWADNNGIIVVYPQASARWYLKFGSTEFIHNPKGCWDWWGYTGENYATKGGAQIITITNIVKELSKKN